MRTKYDGLKKEIKKKKALERAELYKTGGGNPNKIIFKDYEQRLLSILCHVEGLASVNDSDIGELASFI